ncbi:hypothetical protein HDV05_001052 [Chytridiales sp. JEL 0842]|nr:hypothetical protein HDV05_001052 [Chytridiales sp. JEL 0842]
MDPDNAELLITQQLFSPSSAATPQDDSAAGGDDKERLIFHAKVFEDAFDPTTGISKGGGSKARHVVVTVKRTLKGVKIRIHKIKPEKNSTVFVISKTWALDDVRSLESGKDLQVTVNLGKPYTWTLETNNKKIELLFTFMKLCQKYLKRTPKLFNLDEELLTDQMQFITGSATPDIIIKEPTPSVHPASSSSAPAPKPLQPKKAKKALHETSLSSMSIHKPLKGGSKEVEEEKDIDELISKDMLASQPKLVEEQPMIVDLDDLLSDFSWKANGDAADLEARLLTELQALEAANVHAIIQSEEQADIVVQHIHNALEELKVIDDWLGHYTMLLEQMGQDVHQVEVRNKAMQLTSSNQKLLLDEIDKVLHALKLPGSVVESLRNEPLDHTDGIKECERAIQKLNEVVKLKFDDGFNDIGMVTERMALLNGYARHFSVRFTDFLTGYVSSMVSQTLNDKKPTKLGSLRISNLDVVVEKLVRYRTLMQWLKEFDTRKHYEIEIAYVNEMKKGYMREIKEFMDYLRHTRMQRKVNAEDQEYLFSTPQVSVSAAATNALSAMGSRAIGGVVRSNALGANGGSNPGTPVGNGGGSDSKEKSFDKLRARLPGFGNKWRTGSGSSSNAVAAVAQGDGVIEEEGEGDDSGSIRGGIGASVMGLAGPGDDKIWPDEAFTIIYSSVCPYIAREANFLIEFFNLKGKANNRSETGAAAGGGVGNGDAEEIDWQEILSGIREKLRDIKGQNRLQELLNVIYDEFFDESSVFIEAALKYDQTFAIGMLVKVEELLCIYDKSAYTCLLNHLDNVFAKLGNIFERFIDEQIKCIEETKVTSKKRSGILTFVKTFPIFVDRIEHFSVGQEGKVRNIVSKAYSRLVKTIFDTLEAVAKDTPTEIAKDSKNFDDKEHLNVYILTVENMHHFYSEIRSRKVGGSLDQFVKAAKLLYDVNVTAYVRFVVRRPLGKLLEFFEGVDDLLKTMQPEEISFHLQYSKVALKDVLKKYPGKEIKKGIEQLYKRVEKHYTDEDGLLQVVWRGIQEEFTRQLKRYEEVIVMCYPDSGLRIDLTIEELLNFFSELARAH